MRAVLISLVLLLPGCLSSPDRRVAMLNEDGVYLYKKGDFMRARETFELAAKLQPGDPSILYNVGQCYDREGKVKEAEACYRKCLNQDANHTPSKHALAKLLVREGRRKEATETVHTWLVSQPKSAGGYVEDAWRLYQDGEMLKSQARLQQALALDPKHVTALVQLGMLYEVMERPDRALTLYEKALREDPKREDVRAKINELLDNGVTPPLPDN